MPIQSLAIVFASGDTASRPIASVPAIARAVREVALAGVDMCTVCVPAPWVPSAFDSAEIARLAPGLRVIFTRGIPAGSTLVVTGEALVPAAALRAALTGEITPHAGIFPIESATRARLSVAEADALLRAQARAVIAATGKPGDGLVSRLINRPVSQFITRLLLGLGPVRPYQATLGTVIVGLAMVIALLFFPGYQGQLWGALLFQLASVTDGVDGEIARATFRATPQGATFDSLVDAATNLSFFAGMMINLYLDGEVQAVLVAAAALIGVAGGMALLGLTALSDRGPVTFDAVKDRLAPRRSRVMTWLTWFTMRDFYALFALVIIVLGYAVVAAYLFAIIVAGWLIVVVATLMPSFRRTPGSRAPNAPPEARGPSFRWGDG